jgi:hypothetical protein
MNNNTRGFVALLFLEVIVPMTAPPALNQATALSGEAAEGADGAMERGSLQIIMLIDSLIIFYYDVIFQYSITHSDIERRSSGGTESRSRAADGAMERGSISIQVYVS